MVATTHCFGCGTTRPDGYDALSWVVESDEEGGTRWLCPDCAREHLRSIEAKLPEEYW